MAETRKTDRLFVESVATLRAALSVPLEGAILKVAESCYLRVVAVISDHELEVVVTSAEAEAVDALLAESGTNRTAPED